MGGERSGPLGEWLDRLRDAVACCQDIGLIVLADLHVHIPADIEIIALNVGVVMIAVVEYRHDEGEKGQGLACEMLFIPVRVDRHGIVLRIVRDWAMPRLHGVVVVADEVNRGLPDRHDERRMMPHTERVFHPASGKGALEVGCDLRFLLLTHIGHRPARFLPAAPGLVRPLRGPLGEGAGVRVCLIDIQMCVLACLVYLDILRRVWSILYWRLLEFPANSA